MIEAHGDSWCPRFQKRNLGHPAIAPGDPSQSKPVVHRVQNYYLPPRVTVDVFPSLDAAFAEDKQFVDRFKKVHPDMELGTTFERVQKLRSQAEVHLYELEEFVAAGH
jgi:hypothetical protein